MSTTEIIPLLVLVLALLGASGAAPQTMDVVFEGDHATTDGADVLAVGGGDVRVPADTTLDGEVFVIGGNLTVAGEVDGAVRVFAGSASVSDGGTVTGELQHVAGEVSVAEGGAVGRLTDLPAPEPSSPTERVGFLAMQVLVGGAIAALLARRAPGALETVGRAMTDHTLVSAVVGSLGAVTLLVLFVYMAFTLLLLPVSLLGLLGEFLIVVYGFLCLGALVGRRLPVDRPDLAAAAGVGIVLVGLEVAGLVPYLGVLLTGTVAVVGFGAVLLTYFGLRPFRPAEIPG